MISDTNEKTEPAPLTEREMNQFIMLAALPTLERALERLRWLEAENADLKERIDKAYEDIALDQRTNATLRADLAIAKTDLLLTQSRVERFRAHVAALKAKFEGLNDAVEEACGELPEGWSVGIDLERGAATVYVFDPEGESEMVHEDETKVADLIRAAIRKAKEAKPA
jgi:chromosome segregation ATPase